jgi:NAD(P)-dependent dehydrogenase (short-subunit alcohol dehydrogenase family)
MSSNSWVLITGANRTTGLGYLTAKKLVNDGESVIIGARSQASGKLSVRPPLHDCCGLSCSRRAARSLLHLDVSLVWGDSNRASHAISIANVSHPAYQESCLYELASCTRAACF